MIHRNYIFLLVLFVLISCKQNPDRTDILITGELKNLDGIKIYLEQNKQRIDSAIVVNGKFSVSGKVWNNAVADIWFYIKDESDKTIPMWSVTRIFLEHGSSYKFFADGRGQIMDHTFTLQTNSHPAREYYELNRKAFQETQTHEILAKKFKQLRDRKEIWTDTVLYKKYDDSTTYHEKKRESVMLDAYKALIARNPNSYLALSVLSHISNLETDKEFFVKIEKQLKGKYRETYHAKEFIKAFSKVRTDLPVSIEIDATAVDDSPFDFATFKNDKAIVIDFWATWCAPCVAVMPEALAMKEKLKSKNIGYVFLSYDSRIKTWKQQSVTLGLQHSYKIAQSAKPYLDEKLRIPSIPRYILINNRGDVLVRELPSPDEPKFLITIDSAMNKLATTK
ncbi:MAG: AhpC/TSA family protein [Pedobacter sp.]|nr:MAG: AhpC/TSA family protein [Pedobacter sp.]